MHLPPKNKFYQPFILLLLAGIIFIVLSFFDSSFKIGELKFKAFSFLNDIKVDSINKVIHYESTNPSNSNTSKGRDTYVEFSADSGKGLLHFFEALDLLSNGKKKKVRIAYFGDSMIEDDYITQDLRNQLQVMFGGAGVGFLPVTSINAEDRQTIKQTFSSNWKVCELDEVLTHPTGISGKTFIPAWSSGRSNNSWVKFQFLDENRLNDFHQADLFYGKSEGLQTIQVNKIPFVLNGKNAVNRLEFDKPKTSDSYYVTFKADHSLDVFGFNFDSETGIFLDNYSFSGKNGMNLSALPDSVLAGLNNYLNYDLIVLQFGINVLDTKLSNFNWYEMGMCDVVNHFRKSFPNSSILIVSAGDRGIKKNGKWTSNPEIPDLIAAQQNYARKKSCGFWNLYSAMGGYESMAKSWAGAVPALANKDYTHFNREGSKKIASILFDDLISEYNLYKNNFPK